MTFLFFWFRDSLKVARDILNVKAIKHISNMFNSPNPGPSVNTAAFSHLRHYPCTIRGEKTSLRLFMGFETFGFYSPSTEGTEVMPL